MKIDLTVRKIYTEGIERFFVDAWYSFVSLESSPFYRIDSVNSFSVCYELKEALHKSYPKDSQKGLGVIAKEAIAIWEEDVALVRYYSTPLALLKPILGKLIKGEVSPKNCELASYYLGDLIVALEAGYRQNLLQELESAIDANDENKVLRLIRSLLAQLRYEGASLEGLFAMIRDIFIANRSTVPYDFKSNIQFLKRIILRDPSRYSIVCSLESEPKNHSFAPNTHVSIQFQNNIQTPPTIENNRGQRFFAPQEGKFFAEIPITALDDRSAGMKAKKELEDLLDLLRYLNPQFNITVNSNFVAIREDRTARFYPFPQPVQPPSQHFHKKGTQSAHNSILGLLNRPNVQEEAKKRLRASLRLYRIGCETLQAENKFMSWWTAAEYLLGAGQERSFIEETLSRLTPILSRNYIPALLEDYRYTLDAIGITPLQIDAKYPFESFQDIPKSSLFDMFCDPTAIQTLLNLCMDFPFLCYEIDRAASRFSLSATGAGTRAITPLLACLERYEQGLEWDIHRIYRARNEIVHHAKTSENIGFVCANLGFYLQNIISFVTNEFALNPSIHSLEEIYARAGHLSTVSKEELKRGRSDTLREVLDQ